MLSVVLRSVLVECLWLGNLVNADVNGFLGSHSPLVGSLGQVGLAAVVLKALRVGRSIQHFHQLLFVPVLLQHDIRFDQVHVEHLHFA